MSKLYSTTRIPVKLSQMTAQQFKRFRREEDGVITVLACFMILMMLMISGIAVDLMRNEMERVKIQNTADRAVLAAADLDQESPPKEVVTNYFETSGLGSLITNDDINVSGGINYRTVSVTADATTPTNFMSMMGVDALPLISHAEAEEKIAKVEISMVLDISGSMKNDNKMTNLQNAAKVFVDTVIRPETKDLVSLSMVPYSEHVNAGPDLLSKFKVYVNNPYSHCIEFADSDFNSVRLDRGKWYDQVQHFQWNYNGSDNDRTDTVCPRYDYERILPTSQNATAIKAQIDKLKPRAGTSIFAGLKWGAGMLDPDFKHINTKLWEDGIVDGVFKDRPAPYDDADTLKTVILMTDGQHDNSFRIASRYYQSESHARHWHNYNLNWYLRNYVRYEYRSSFYYKKYWASKGDDLLENICNKAKDKKIVIWSIGFEVSDHGANVMRNCASSPSHFFRVEGVEISEAFKAIARTINQLRLTQ
ncbi:TadE/TadG family type IV pilus assembly protein [Sulfitobacter sp. S190]|uniref:TadE/TadG family type IV pilus assembly protein n=1 Tax=Sulfitobacter sp. S190 TaxID=2867022 RepID=UPI0021A4EC7B|nr:TadE/TadG family type IV pilus assembly protein [Sulfitobacter sp. S190]UWR23529.1 Tad domain-containing protein [Sulfitobacter sp. S190]